MTGPLIAVVLVGTVCLGCGDGAGDPDAGPWHDARASLDAPPPLIDAAGPPTLDAGPPDAASPLCPLPIDVPDAPLLEPGPVHDRLYWIASEYEGELTRDWGGVCPCIATQRLALQPRAHDAAVLFAVAPSSIDVVVDMAAENLLWTERDEGRIRRRNRFGAGEAVTVIDGLENPHELALDPVARRLYWTEVDALGGWTRIRTARIDGAELATLVTVAPGEIHSLRIDAELGRMYWIESEPGLDDTRVIRSASLAGDDVATIVTPTLGTIQNVVIDTTTGELYWTEWPDGTINWVFMRANADGSSPMEIELDPGFCPDSSLEPLLLSAAGDTLVFSVRTPAKPVLCAAPKDGGPGVLLDPYGDSVRHGQSATGASPDRSYPDVYYWLDTGVLECTDVFGEPAFGECVAVRRARRSATGAWTETQILAVGEFTKRGPLAVDPVEEWLYWTLDGTIYRIRPDGTGPNEVFLEAESHPRAMEVDPIHRHLYFTPGGPQLYRAALDGSDVELLPFGSARFHLVPTANHIYWVEDETTIKRANLDGSDIQVVVTDERIYDVAIDTPRRTLYWFQRPERYGDNYGALIWRSDLCDADDRELLAFHHFSPEGGYPPWDVALDPESGSFYHYCVRFRAAAKPRLRDRRRDPCAADGRTDSAEAT